MKRAIMKYYLKLLKYLCRRELKKISDMEHNSLDDLIYWHDYMAIECVNAETKGRERMMGVCVRTAIMLELLKRMLPEPWKVGSPDIHSHTPPPPPIESKIAERPDNSHQGESILPKCTCPKAILSEGESCFFYLGSIGDDIGLCGIIDMEIK